MASRNPDHLQYELLSIYFGFVKQAKEAGIDVLLTCTYRSNDEQNALYAQGRTTPGRIVTNAKGGQSKHNAMKDGKPASKAFDVVPMVNGKPQWSADAPEWQALGKIGVSLGLEWGGNWTRFKEYPHFQLKE